MVNSSGWGQHRVLPGRQGARARIVAEVPVVAQDDGSRLRRDVEAGLTISAWTAPSTPIPESEPRRVLRRVSWLSHAASTAPSRCSPQMMCIIIIIEPTACWNSVGEPFKPPGPITLNASFEGSPNTRHRTRGRPLAWPRATTDCAAAHAACDADGRKFAGGLSLAVPGPEAVEPPPVVPDPIRGHRKVCTQDYGLNGPSVHRWTS